MATKKATRTVASSNPSRTNKRITKVGAPPVGPCAIWDKSHLHNLALAQAAEFEDRNVHLMFEHSHDLTAAAMWPLLMAQYEEDVAAEKADEDPETSGSALRYFAGRCFLVGTFYGVRAAQYKREDEKDERHVRRAGRKRLRHLERMQIEAERAKHKAEDGGAK